MTNSPWAVEEILITVRAYPNPSKSHRETSCVAGVRLRDRTFVRLHPIPYRLLADEQKFRKYDVVRARIQRSSDSRPESYRVDLDHGIEIVRRVGTKNRWEDRHQILRPLIAPSVEWLRNDSGLSLGLIKVRAFQGLDLKPQDGKWTAKELAKLNQMSILGQSIRQLERPPFEFRYRFLCENPSCRGHNMSIIDWEVIQSYRRWRPLYGERTWESKFRETYEDKLPITDFHLYLGNHRRWRNSWMVIGVYYPPAGSV